MIKIRIVLYKKTARRSRFSSPFGSYFVNHHFRRDFASSSKYVHTRVASLAVRHAQHRVSKLAEFRSTGICSKIIVNKRQLFAYLFSSDAEMPTIDRANPTVHVINMELFWLRRSRGPSLVAFILYDWWGGVRNTWITSRIERVYRVCFRDNYWPLICSRCHLMPNGASIRVWYTW